MTLLLFLKPIFHQGFSPPSDDEPDKLPKKKKRRKTPKKFIEDTARALELKTVDVSGYIESVFAKEAEILKLKEAARLAEERARKAREEQQKEEEQRLAEEQARIAEENERTRIQELIAEIGEMVKQSFIAKRKRLNTLIASILDWL